MPDTIIDIEKDFIGCLPELSSVANSFLDLTRQLNIAKSSFASLLSADPVLQQRIFAYINLVLNQNKSGYLSINKGISLMGIHKFKNLVIVFSLFPIFQESDCIELFKYSLLTAYYSKSIASQYNLINPHDAFLLGFLHDIGKIAMKNKFGSEYSLASFDENHLLHEYSPEEELNRFGCCHADLSEFICKSWNLPVVVVDSIKNHHNPLSAMLPQVASIIYLSELMALKNVRFSEESQKVFNYMQVSKSDLAQHTFGADKKVFPFLEVLNLK